MEPGSIGRYEIVEEIGRGGMGVVYRAVDPTIHRTIALKTLRLESQSDRPEEVLQRFRHEAQLSGRLSHPNIITIFDAGDDGKIFYIAMEFIAGKTLHAILKEQRLSIDEILKVSRQMCSALDYAHQNGIVHRDIKPANVMGPNLDSLKIMDFGIAKSDLGLTMTGQVLGTPAYMSPEQVMGRQLDGRSDLFSFAVMLYQMVTGEMPFPGNTATSIIYKIANERPVAPSDLDVTVHPGLSAVITKALAKNPDERFQTGAELVKALENYKTQPVSAKQAVSADAPTVTILRQVEPTRVMPVSPAARGIVNKPAGSRAGWIIAALIAVVLAAGAYISVMRKNMSAGREVAVATPAQPATPTPTPKTASEVPATAPGEAKPAETEFGEVRFTSAPEGAQVSVDGKTEKSWVTPFTASKLTAGEHEVKFSKQDFVSQSHRVKAVPGTIEHLAVSLVQSGGTLDLNSDPPGAVIFIDGAAVAGQTTPAQIHVSAGPHELILRKPGFDEENTTVDLKDGETYPYSPTLDRMQGQMNAQQQERLRQALKEGKGIIAVVTDPPGATLQINGRTVQRTTPFRNAFPPGDYQLTISLDGYATVRKQITVQAGKPTRVQLRLVGQR